MTARTILLTRPPRQRGRLPIWALWYAINGAPYWGRPCYGVRRPTCRPIWAHR
jgi:hypothetical protein